MPEAPVQEQVWDERLLAENPHATSDKAVRVRKMFSAIAPSYDLNNRLHSLGQDQSWRRKAVRLCEVTPSDVVLDVACGTADLSMAFLRGGAGRVIGMDFTHEMVRVGRKKQQGLRDGHLLNLADADAQRLPVADASVDVVSIAFGIRNVARPELAVAEFFRVLKPGGRLVILEFSLPTRRWLRVLYDFYFRHIMPVTATLISRDRSGAYRYLPRSVNTFLGRGQMVDLMEGAGFSDIHIHPMTFGIAVGYLGYKSKKPG